MVWQGLACVFMSIRLAEIPAWKLEMSGHHADDLVLRTAFNDTPLRLSRCALYVLLFVTNEGGIVD